MAAPPALPADAWALVLARGGPLALAPWVRVDARAVGALRVQRAWRARVHPSRWLRAGDDVLVRPPAARAWRAARARPVTGGGRHPPLWTLEEGGARARAGRRHFHFLSSHGAPPLWVRRGRRRPSEPERGEERLV